VVIFQFFYRNGISYQSQGPINRILFFFAQIHPWNSEIFGEHRLRKDQVNGGRQHCLLQKGHQQEKITAFGDKSPMVATLLRFIHI